MPKRTDDISGLPIISIEDLAVSYGKKNALVGITLPIWQGEILAIIGPSGCGKSTLIRAINRMTDLTDDCHVSGQILLDGENILDSSVDVCILRQRVGMILQKPEPFPFSIFDNVAYGPRYIGKKKGSDLNEIVIRSLEAAGLWNEVKDRLHQIPHLSGGQLQRLCIARVLANDPKVILMDEPCSALDPANSALVEDWVTEQEGNRTIVIVTHRMEQARRVSKRTAFLLGKDRESAKLVEYGLTEQIFTNPQQQETQDFITGQFG
jgi:phosphate transport system ATP-binding protein